CTTPSTIEAVCDAWFAEHGRPLAECKVRGDDDGRKWFHSLFLQFKISSIFFPRNTLKVSCRAPKEHGFSGLDGRSAR
ncbi:hypothetical protein, partial [Rhizobium rhizogenes]|uniref:hypothetical protein n=1 Tax=Rhizobium rhizogenes TaxID=359 RepID=UPI00386F51F2